jgi:hypothetical protein
MPIQTISLKGRDQNLNNFCPFCGVKNSSQNGEITECPHLLFIYLNIADELLFVKKDLFPNLGDNEIFENMHELIDNLEIEDAFLIEEYMPLDGSQYIIGYKSIDC